MGSNYGWLYLAEFHEYEAILYLSTLFSTPWFFPPLKMSRVAMLSVKELRYGGGDLLERHTKGILRAKWEL